MFDRLVQDGKIDLNTFDFSKIDICMDDSIDITSVGIERVKAKIAEANRRFYFRPRIIWRILKNINSVGQLVNTIRTGLRFTTT